jgi:hypothetical protein
MQAKSVSKFRRMAVWVMIGCAVAAVSSSLWAANDNAGDKEKHCSNRTLNGSYGFTVKGLLGIPGGGTQIRGVILQEYDGNGHLTQVEHVVVDGAPPSEEWTPGSGTYTVKPDCTGSAPIPVPSSGAPPLVVFFVVTKHGRMVREVSNGNAITATGEKVD